MTNISRPDERGAIYNRMQEFFFREVHNWTQRQMAPNDGKIEKW